MRKKLLSSKKASELLEGSFFLMKNKQIKLTSADSTGFEARHVSQYFLQRKYKGEPVYARFHPKMSIICDCKTHLILSVVTGRGPFPDAPSFKNLLRKIPKSISIDKLIADAGYDSEKNHELAREKYKIRSFFPPLIGRHTKKLPSGKYRRPMKKLFKFKENIKYGQRWQVETIFSMIKRRLTTSARARSYNSQSRELSLIALTYNIMVVCAWFLLDLFYRAGRSPIDAALKRSWSGAPSRQPINTVSSKVL